MKTKREINNAELKVLNKRLRRWGHAPIDFNHYMEIKGTMSNITDNLVGLFDKDHRLLVEFLFTPSTINMFETAIATSSNGAQTLHSLINWLEKIEKRQDRNTIFFKGIEKGREKIEKEIEEKQNAIKWYSVKEFATLVNLHPHTIRKYYNSGKLNGRQDTKGIFIDANELEKYI
jgi:hypothetical protein